MIFQYSKHFPNFSKTINALYCFFKKFNFFGFGHFTNLLEFIIIFL